MGKPGTIAQEAIGLMTGDDFGCKAFWDSNPEWPCLELNLSKSAVKFRHSSIAALREKSAGRAPSVRVIPWHLPYK